MSMYIGNLLYQVTQENLSNVVADYATVKARSDSNKP